MNVERLGGLAGFGGPNLKSVGSVETATLSAADRQAIESLFASPPTTPSKPDEFRYKLSRTTAKGTESVEVPESHVPMAVKSVVKDQLR